MPGGKISKKVHTFFSSEKKLLFGVRTSKEIKEIRKKLDSIANDRTQFGFSDVYRPVKRKVETWSYVHEDSIIGRDADKEVIMGMFLRESDSSVDNVSFVSIVGMGGLGKTALAQLVYNDVRISDEFDLKLWVCVSDEFILQEILFKMLKSATEQDYGDIGAEGVQNKVRRRIEGKKYFLILDDLWNESRDEWLKLREFLQVGARGSRVVVTTRSKKVAGAIGDDPMYMLRGLSDDDSWSLFKRVAFNQGSREVDDDLVEIGKNIVKKCANVPLAIRVVGSMLYGHEKSKWKLFERAELPEMVRGEKSIMPILKFSYHHLPPQLKSCFSYCALFPKDYMIDTELLIRLWSAQGYLEPANDLQNTEDVGEEYFSILMQRCFLQDIECHATYGEVAIFSCKMHDLIHDLAQEVAGKESLLMEDTSKAPFDRKSRHLAISSRRTLLLSPSDTFGKLSGLRTFLRNSYRCLECESQQVSTILAKCRRLRVLDLHMLRIKVLPSTIKNLLHLRYLDLSHNRQLMTLPESITTLYNLQVLNLRYCDYLKELPKGLKELVNLMHLDIEGCYMLSHMPVAIDSLTGLCTLTKFVLSQDSSEKGQMGQLRDLIPLINLRGTIQIIFKKGYTYDSLNLMEEKYLLNKEHIKVLWIGEVDRCSYKEEGTVEERLLERLEPHSDLREIKIGGYKGVTLPRWAATLSISLPQLVRISLENFHDLQQLPPLTQLQHLKHLKLSHMPNVELMENVATSFPSLETLYLEKCPRLKSFPTCPHVYEFSLWGLNEALAFCKQGDDEVNATLTTPAASSFSTTVMLEKLRYVDIKAATLLSMSLPQLVRISLENFHDLQQLPPLTQLQHLKHLTLSHMPNVELMENDNNVTPNSFPSLETLYLEKCPSLKSFPRCPNVKRFSLKGLNEALAFCKLGDDEVNATTPVASSFSATSSSGNGDNSAGDDVFDLRGLETDKLGLIKSLFGEPLRSIYDLTLCDMEVESLSSVVQEFHQKYAFSIHILKFEGFRYLKSLSSGGMEHLTNLQNLSLWGCLNLELEEEQGFPWKSLHTLFYLHLCNLPKLVHLPNGVQCLTSLRALYVEDCNNLETLPEWLDCLKSLRSLQIICCPKLKLLLEAILPFLTDLYISSCDGLKERYSESNGSYFHKISHIPNLYLFF